MLGGQNELVCYFVDVVLLVSVYSHYSFGIDA